MSLMVSFEFWVQMQKCNYRATIFLVVSGMVSYSNCSLPFLLMVHRAYSFSRTLSGFAFWFIFGTHPLNECEAISISLWLGSISLMPVTTSTLSLHLLAICVLSLKNAYSTFIKAELLFPLLGLRQYLNDIHSWNSG